MGELTRKGESRPVTQDELALYPKAQTLQAQHRVPVLQHANNPHEYLFFAMFDGTGQDADNPEQLRTNVGVLKAQVYEQSKDPGLRVGGHYVEGIGTQDDLIPRLKDSYHPFTWDDKIEEAYRALATQAWEWQQQDPAAQIRIAEVGYSRGAVLASGLARLVDQYGIAHPKDVKFGRDEHGNITVETQRPLLVQPGQTAQAMGLFDPVATNMPGNYDARLAASVISAYSQLATSELRVSFSHQSIVDAELTADARFLRVPVPGGHSNVGGGNADPGLESMSFNGMVDYLNGLRDEPLFAYRPLPNDPALYTVYQARGITAVPGLDRDGERDLREDLANCKIVDPCRDAEPMNQALAAQFEYRRQQPSAPRLVLSGPQHKVERNLAEAIDPATQHALQQALQVQQLQQQGVETRQREAEQARKAEQERADERSAQWLPFSHPDHPQHALYADVQQRFQAKGHTLSEAQLSVLTGQMHATGATPGWQGAVTVREGRAFAMAAWPPGTRATIDLGTPAPTVQDTMQDFQVAQQSMAKHMEMLKQQQAMAQEHGHGLSR